jgi:hypothetical protein
MPRACRRLVRQFVFDSAGLTKNRTTWKNRIAYTPDWSTWNDWQHSGANGQWPHLDQLFASANIVTGEGGLDALNWFAAAPTSGRRPVNQGRATPLVREGATATVQAARGAVCQTLGGVVKQAASAQ